MFNSITFSTKQISSRRQEAKTEHTDNDDVKVTEGSVNNLSLITTLTMAALIEKYPD